MSGARLTPSSRGALLDQLEGETFDVVVIGGGITGAGIARDAAGRGLRVALLEADDFASGTSSRSSGLIHGGLRYLLKGEVGLVRSTARERAAICAMAPHLAEPCWMLLPAESEGAAVVYRTAVAMYERLGAVVATERHRCWRGAELRSREPALRPSYGRVVAYHEYLTDDARLVLAVLRAAAGSGACVASRVPVIGLVHRRNRVEGVIGRCATTGREIAVRGRVVVNAAGPWVDDLARLEPGAPRPRLHRSKGVHVVIERDRLPANNVVVCRAEDRRLIFAVPRGDVVYVGTTDTTHTDTDHRSPVVTDGDVRYLLAPLAQYFDVAPLRPTDVIATWAGLRPLVADRHDEPKEVSRRDEIRVGDAGMITVAGGKLTGFRQMAEEAVAVVGRKLDRSLPEGPGASPLPGAATLEPGAGRLDRLYGSEATDVAHLDPEPVLEGGSVTVGEIEWAVEVEAALTLEDVMYRRTRAARFLPAERERLAPAIADHLATRLGWDDARRAEELAKVQRCFAEELSFMSQDAHAIASDDHDPVLDPRAIRAPISRST